MYCYVFTHLTQAYGKEKGSAPPADLPLHATYCVFICNAVIFGV